MTPHETLLAAKALIPDEARRPRLAGSHCPATALVEVADWGPEQEKAGREFAKAAGRKTLSDYFSWNDAPERTFSEVHAAFDRAIEATKSEEKADA